MRCVVPRCNRSVSNQSLHTHMDSRCGESRSLTFTRAMSRTPADRGHRLRPSIGSAGGRGVGVPASVTRSDDRQPIAFERASRGLRARTGSRGPSAALLGTSPTVERGRTTPNSERCDIQLATHVPHARSTAPDTPGERGSQLSQDQQTSATQKNYRTALRNTECFLSCLPKARAGPPPRHEGGNAHTGRQSVTVVERTVGQPQRGRG